MVNIANITSNTVLSNKESGKVNKEILSGKKRKATSACFEKGFNKKEKKN